MFRSTDEKHYARAGYYYSRHWNLLCPRRGRMKAIGDYRHPHPRPWPTVKKMGTVQTSWDSCFRTSADPSRDWVHSGHIFKLSFAPMRTRNLGGWVFLK